jgi:hypothetical protein
LLDFGGTEDGTEDGIDDGSLDMDGFDDWLTIQVNLFFFLSLVLTILLHQND